MYLIDTYQLSPRLQRCFAELMKNVCNMHGRSCVERSFEQELYFGVVYFFRLVQSIQYHEDWEEVWKM